MKDEFNKWYKHSNFPTVEHPDGYKLQLKGDTRLGPCFLEQISKEIGLPNFMKDFDKILKYAEENKLSLFTLYIAEADKQ